MRAQYSYRSLGKYISVKESLSARGELAKCKYCRCARLELETPRSVDTCNQLPSQKNPFGGQVGNLPQGIYECH